MRSLATARLTWWDSLVSALIVLALLGTTGGMMVLCGWFGPRAIKPLLGLAAIPFAFTVQRNGLRAMLAFAAGWLIHG